MNIARRTTTALTGALAGATRPLALPRPAAAWAATSRAISASAAAPKEKEAGTGAKVAKSKLDASIPLPPKSPPSPYVLFFMDFIAKHRAEYTTSEGKLSAPGLAKEAGKQWNALDADAQRPYQAEAKKRSDVYKREYASYYASLSPEQLGALNAHLPRPLPLPADHPDYHGRGSTSASRAAARARSGQPVKGTTGFFAFLAQFRKSDELKRLMEEEGIKPSASVVFSAKMAGRKWGVMSEAEKKAYADEAASSRAAYKEWKDKQSS